MFHIGRKILAKYLRSRIRGRIKKQNTTISSTVEVLMLHRKRGRGGGAGIEMGSRRERKCHNRKSRPT
jgi:hypothetical protein